RLSLAGELLFARGASLRLEFRGPHRDREPARISGTDVAVVPAGRTVSFPEKTVRPGWLGNPWIMVGLVDDSGLAVGAERALGRLEFYSGACLDTIVGSNSHSADRAAVSLRRNFSPLDHVTVQGDYGRSRDLLDVDQGTVAADGDVTRWVAGASGIAWRAEGSY